MNELAKKDKIENMIYEIRGREVILDSDLAKLYGVETKRINEAVRRNKNKFPERLCFRLTEHEILIISRSQIATLKNVRGQHRKYLPTVFTEQGIYMLATILKSKIATDTTIAIMDAFVLMKKYISNDLVEQKYVNKLVYNLDDRVSLLEASFSEINNKEKVNPLFFEGQIYDAYSLLRNIFDKANDEIIIIDNYIY